jgi:hypothetical protein
MTAVWKGALVAGMGWLAAAACGGVSSVDPGAPGASGAAGSVGGAPSSGGAQSLSGGRAAGGMASRSAGGVNGGAGGHGDSAPGGSSTSTGGRATISDASVSSDASALVTCSFAFAVTTETLNGRFAPRNAGAIWIEAANGLFVKTLEHWGLLGRPSYTVAWYESSGGNVVDAVTAATRVAHGPHSATWNCTDTSEHPVPRGGYRVCVLVSEDNRFPFVDAGPPQPVLCSPFTVGSGPFDLAPPDSPPFLDLHLSMR